MIDTVLRKLEKLVGGLFVAQSTFVNHISISEEESRAGKSRTVLGGSVLMMVRVTKESIQDALGVASEICVYADYMDLRTNCKVRILHYYGSSCGNDTFLSPTTVDALLKRVL